MICGSMTTIRSPFKQGPERSNRRKQNSSNRCEKIQTLDTATYIYLASSINKSCDDDCLTEQSPWGATTLSNIGSRDIAN